MLIYVCITYGQADELQQITRPTKPKVFSILSFAGEKKKNATIWLTAKVFKWDRPEFESLASYLSLSSSFLPRWLKGWSRVTYAMTWTRANS